MVSNLPYSIATPLLLRTIAELPAVGAWTVMVQREIADRLRAAPGSRTYGAPSVLVQLACEVELLRTVDRAVFTPRPRVDSALLRLRAARPGGAAGARRGSCATRSRTGASRWRARSSSPAGPRGKPVRAALGRLGLAEDARAEALAPADFVRARGALWGSVDAARAGEAQPLPLPRAPRPRRRACTSSARCSAR